MHIIPYIGRIFNVGEYDVNFIDENVSYCPNFCGALYGKVNINGDIYDVNIYMENIENDGEIIYPRQRNVINIYDYEIVEFIIKNDFEKVKNKLQNLIMQKLHSIY